MLLLLRKGRGIGLAEGVSHHLSHGGGGGKKRVRKHKGGRKRRKPQRRIP